jgi:hypothetical protein
MTASEASAKHLGKEVYKKVGEEMRDSAPKVAINIVVAVLVWVIGNYVFIPISRVLHTDLGGVLAHQPDSSSRPRRNTGHDPKGAA